MNSKTMEIFRKYGPDHIGQMLAENPDWSIHLDFSPLRQSLLNWYEFRPDASLLELSAGCGTMTELFCRRLASVTAVAKTREEGEILSYRFAGQGNLTILTEKFPEEGVYFDYIFAPDLFEACEQEGTLLSPEEVFDKIMSYLKPDGTLLFTCQNRYALEGFCGANRHLHEGSLPFEEISARSAKECKNLAWSYRELTSFLKSRDYLKQKLYYPVPDALMPQMVYTDSYRKGVNTAERLIDYHYHDQALLAQEHRIFPDLIDSGALPFLANAYLAEVTRGGELSDIIYAVPTTDRGESFGMATTIRENSRVKKRPLYPNGRKNLEHLHQITRELAALSIPVVQTEFTEDTYGPVLSMPYIDAEPLSSVLKEYAARDPERVVSLFDRIYQMICQSTGSKAYLDLAPCNCFYDTDKDRLLFYDQEFVMEGASAGYVMYRTIKYAWQSIPALSSVLPVDKVYERYGITPDIQAEYELSEQAFLQSVRHTDTYRQMYVWATPDRDRMKENCRKVDAVTATPAKPYHIGYVPGVFDLFHTGHLRLLERCKARCDYLIVGVLTDELVEYYKGHRTVIDYENRARVIGALKVVDEVIPVDFSNTDKLDAWNQLHYDCHFSGDDHINHWNDVWEELKKRGSNMEFFSYTQGISSTQIREKMKQ